MKTGDGGGEVTEHERVLYQETGEGICHTCQKRWYSDYCKWQGRVRSNRAGERGEWQWISQHQGRRKPQLRLARGFQTRSEFGKSHELEALVASREGGKKVRPDPRGKSDRVGKF